MLDTGSVGCVRECVSTSLVSSLIAVSCRSGGEDGGADSGCGGVGGEVRILKMRSWRCGQATRQGNSAERRIANLTRRRRVPQIPTTARPAL